MEVYGGSLSLPFLISPAVSHFLQWTELAVGMQYIIHRFEFSYFEAHMSYNFETTSISTGNSN